MAGESVARNYAAALFELAGREGEVEAYGRALDVVVRLLEETTGFRGFLETPRIPAKEKREVLHRAFADRIPHHVFNFLLIVLDKRRERLLPEISREYGNLADEAMGRARVELSLAREPGDGEIAEIQGHLSRILGKEAIPELQVDPELLGGIHFRSGDTIFDGSVRRRLQRMRRELLTADILTDQG